MASLVKSDHAQFMWTVERIVHFEPHDFVKDGLSHFGFHDRRGRLYAVDHGRHFAALVRDGGRIEWTVSALGVAPGIPNVQAPLSFPMYVDVLPDGSPIVSNFGNAQLYRIDLHTMEAELLVDGPALGMVDMGNCVVDRDGFVWVNEVRGCRVWCFAPSGAPVLTLGNGRPGFHRGVIAFEEARFGWIYDLRLGPRGDVYILDSRNYAVRVIDPSNGTVRTVAGTGEPGYSGDGGDPLDATFGGDADADFDGPISLSLDEDGNAYVGDRFNHVVRSIEWSRGVVSTIAGRPDADDNRPNVVTERDPARLNLPQISSMDYDRGRLFVPTDIADGAGDLVVLRRA